ncbi:MAG TPA: glycosyltransferase, partial [Dehalococcoidia bacterium]|nr:glycosyltransferase [Dehalococcoidia bacterium]
FTRRQERRSPDLIPLGPGVRVVHLMAGEPAPLSRQELVRPLPAFLRGLLAFGNDAYDLVHSHYWLSASAGAILSRRWGVPHVATFHTLGEVKNQARPEERESQNRIRAERAVAEGAERIICCSEAERALLLDLYDADPARVVVVPCGVDLERFYPIAKEEARALLGLPQKATLLYVGRLEPLKGVELLLRATAQLMGRAIPLRGSPGPGGLGMNGASFQLLIIGGDRRPPGEKRRLKGLAGRLGLDGRARFLGPVEHGRMPLYYSAADVCLVPSYYESFGIAALEAMACGTAVVAARVGGLAGLIADGETGYLVTEHRPEAFSQRLELLLGDPALRRRLGEAARAVAEGFSWRAVADALEAVYGGLVAPPEGYSEATSSQINLRAVESAMP